MDKDQILKIAILLLLFFVIYKCFFQEKSKQYYINNAIQPFKQEKPSTLYLFYADWCGHCKTFKPEWQQLEKELSNTNIITKKINGDSEDKEDQDLMLKYNVSGFPTIILLLPDETTYHYNGSRNKNDLLNATKNHIKNGDSNFQKM